jgi:VIT1/CCC1 family predicted Fe2+/Mn2+ transporter
MQPEIDAVRADIDEGKAEVRGLQSEVAGIAEELRDLVRAELDLAKAETKEQVGVAVKMTAWGVAGLMTAFVMVVWVALTATYALANAVEPWIAALIVTLALGAIALISALMAKSKLSQFSPMPKRTANSLKEDLTWAKHQLKSKPASGEGATL